MANVLCVRAHQGIIVSPPKENPVQLTFLQAAVPLTKKYTKRNDGGYDTKSYPLVSRVTSKTEEVDNIDSFAAALQKHSEAGNCLHTGSLDAELKDESRKGHHEKDEKRSWITLDIDGLDHPTIEDFIKDCLPDAFHKVSYIVQHSPSSGIKPGLRAHVYFLLDRPEDMSVVCDWIKLTNLVTEKLRNQVTLSTSKKVLSYPLDWVANKNGRVVYIAAPECVGFEDPIKDRIEVVSKEYPELRYAFSAASPGEIKTQVQKRVNELRVAEGLKPTRANLYEMRNGEEVLRKSQTDPGRIHDCEPDSDFIMRCNIDGGDSHAYFYYIERPALIRNHKGEPQLFMEAIDKKYYDTVAMPEARARMEKKQQPFVFRNQFDDKWYCGLRIGEEITEQPLAVGSEQKITHYFTQHGGLGVPDPIEAWKMEFNPMLDKQWNPDKHVFNTWRMSDHMKNATYRTLSPPVITKIIAHAVGSDGDAYWHFINWLAYIYQNRTKTGTAWILHGVQGTGKGLLVDHVLRPIFGKDYVCKQQSRNLKAEFNGWMERAIIVNLDEFDVSDAGSDSGSVMQALKMWITDAQLPIRALHKESRMTDNYSNFILTTNAKSALPVDDGDRRMNFGVRQEEKLVITPEEVDAIPGELLDFAGYLGAYEVDKMKAHTCLENEAKTLAKALSKTSIEEFVEAVRVGDMQYFIDGTQERPSDAALPGYYQAALDKWISDAKNDRESIIAVADLLLAYKMICSGNKDVKATKFMKTMAFKALPAKRLRDASGGRPFGWRVKWDIDEETLRNIGGHLKAVKSQEELEDEIRKEVASPE